MDEAEIEALKTKADELEAFKNESAPKLEAFQKAEAEWKAKEKEMEEQMNPHWKKAQAQIKNYKEALKSKGIPMDDDGNPIVEEKFSMDDVVKKTQETTRKEFLNNRLDELLENYNAEDAKVVRKQYEKLTAGEEVTMQNIRGFVQSAEGASGFSKPNAINRANNARGGSPRYAENNPDVHDDATVESLQGLMGLKTNKKK